MSLLIGLVLLVGWLLAEHIELIDRPAKYEMFNLILLVLIPVAFLKILWDIYLVYYKVPLITINADSLSLHNPGYKNSIIPFSKIEEIEIAGSKYSCNVTLSIKKTPFNNIKKRIYEVLFTEEAERYLVGNNVKVAKSITPVIYLDK